MRDSSSASDSAPTYVCTRLILAEIIPTVIPTVFEPQVDAHVSWKHEDASFGNSVKPKKVQDPPHLKLVPKDQAAFNALSSVPLTIVLSDPDAPSRDNPKWSQVCHWIATNLTLSHPDDEVREAKAKYDEIMEWKPPGPPPKTGKHRYVFVALAPLNNTRETLHLTKPADRRRWGYDDKREGLARWMLENQLGVVGANFMYAQNKKQ